MIAGEEDQVVHREQTARIHGMVSRSVVRWVSDAGHMVHHAAPDRLIDAATLMIAWPQVGETESIE